MKKTEAMKLFNLLLNDFPEAESIESRIKSGVCKMAASMWRVYWEAVFENKNPSNIEFSQEKSPFEATKELWQKFVTDEKERWLNHKAKLVQFGRKEDAHKEQMKLDQLEKLIKIWEQKVEKN